MDPIHYLTRACWTPEDAAYRTWAAANQRPMIWVRPLRGAKRMAVEVYLQFCAPDARARWDRPTIAIRLDRIAEEFGGRLRQSLPDWAFMDARTSNAAHCAEAVLALYDELTAGCP